MKIAYSFIISCLLMFGFSGVGSAEYVSGVFAGDRCAACHSAETEGQDKIYAHNYSPDGYLPDKMSVESNVTSEFAGSAAVNASKTVVALGVGDLAGSTSDKSVI